MGSIIEVEDLVKRYRNATANAVDGVSMSVNAGEFFALLGPNGAGKTTTISILTTTLAPTSGTARIAGHDVRAEAGRVRREVGIIFQRPSLPQNLTGEENVRLHAILYGLYPWRPTVALMPAEYRGQLHELATLLGLESEIFKPLRTYSGGMRRKLEIVRRLNPVQDLPPWLDAIARLAPLRYAVDLARSVFYAGRPEEAKVVLHGPVVDLAVIAVLLAIFLPVGTFLFVRAERNR
jgi:ABC-type lipoprotein export system ATPase subunit